MYHTCLHCQKDLGANAAIEHLPIGRRVAFDGHKGRLWVVCGKCGRWNLVPFEDRWEALEECEKAYRGATQRASTGQIAMARLAEGLDLVRIGEPLRPEFAAWRYSAVLEARRRRYIVRGTAAIGAFIGGGLLLGAAAGVGSALLLGEAPTFWEMYRMRFRKVLSLRDLDGRPHRLSHWKVLNSEMLTSEGGYPGLKIPLGKKDQLVLPGPVARNALPVVLSLVNQEGAGRKQLAGALQVLETQGGAEGFLAGADRLIPPWKKKEGARQLMALRGTDRLALEMALHEETERRALEGELEILLETWREAEELAGISDRLTVPPDVDEKLGQIKSGRR